LSKRAIQEHHISYNPEVKVVVYKGEHKILGELTWFSRKSLSKGLIVALKQWIKENEARAVDLVAPEKKKRRRVSPL